MNLSEMIATVKRHPHADQIGMVLCHNGIVRGTARGGRPVEGLIVRVDDAQLARVVAEHKKRPGIVEILVEIFADRRLNVGDDVMYLVVAGDIRDTVVSVLAETLDAIKTTVTHKTEFFV